MVDPELQKKFEEVMNLYETSPPIRKSVFLQEMIQFDCFLTQTKVESLEVNMITMKYVSVNFALKKYEDNSKLDSDNKIRLFQFYFFFPTELYRYNFYTKKYTNNELMRKIPKNKDKDKFELLMLNYEMFENMIKDQNLIKKNEKDFDQTNKYLFHSLPTAVLTYLKSVVQDAF